MNFKKILMISFSILMLLGLSACDVESEEERNTREQNERVYVQGLEDTVLSLVETITSDGRDQDDVAALEEQILANFPERLAQDTSASPDLNERQARLEAMMISIRTDLDTLLEAYESALADCDSCEDNTPASVLEEQVRSAVVVSPAADDIEDVVAASDDVVTEAEPVEAEVVTDADAAEAEVVTDADAAEAEVVTDADTAEAEVVTDADTAEVEVVADADPSSDAEEISSDLIGADELEISSSLAELRRREIELNQEKTGLFEASGYSLDSVSERVVAIDDEIAAILNERDALTLRLADLRLARIEAAE